MTEKDFKTAYSKPIGNTFFKGNVGLKKVINGFVMMFYDDKTDTITSSCYIPTGPLGYITKKTES